MASKSAAHAAGIFSDMTVDGPEIGTLVIVVDRAKNLPNRKSIGKQDPYCAARLGKEAKKTETDKRGGQTPKWDQEMRFTVHDSPDYYQLKVSVFNDDKKTDLIGETWIDLKDIIMPGGGQSDVWHNLNFRNKYAGEVRMEITYYDTRAKQEKPRTREGTPANAGGSRERDGAGGPRVQKERVKRRPLPSDPITGIAPPLAAEPPQPQRVGPRDPRPKVAPAPVPVPVEPQQERPAQPQRGYPTGQPEYQQQEGGYRSRQQSPEREQKQSYSQRERMGAYAQPVQPQSGYLQDQSPLQRVEYPNQDYGRPTSRGDQGRYEQPPPQAQYNNKPSLNLARSNQSLKNQEPQYGQVPGLQESQVARDLYNQRYNQQPQPAYAESVTSSQQNDDPYTRGRTDQRYEYDSPQPYQPPAAAYDPFSSPDGPPPPPPIHRHPVSANSSAPATPGYGYQAPNVVKDQFERLRDGHRNSMPTYGSAPSASYQNTYTPTRPPYAPQPQQPQLQHAYTEPIVPHSEQPRHKLLDGYGNHYSSMQPTVEDAPPTPAPFQQEMRQTGVPQEQQWTSESQYDDVPSPAPLSFNRPDSSGSSMQQPAPASSYNGGYAPDSYMNQSHSAPPPNEYGQPSYVRNDNRSRSPAPPPSEYAQPSYDRGNRSRSPAPPRSYQDQHRSLSPDPPQRYSEEDLARPGSSYMPPLPPTLVAGLDPAIAQEISDRIYSESRFQRQPRQTRQEPQETNWARDAAQRHAETNQYGRPTSSSGRSYAPASSYGPQERQGRSIPNTFIPSRSRGTSPMPPAPSSYGTSPAKQHTISRKSVSPAPPPSRGSDGEPVQRRLSAVPFCPDDYSTLNPNVPAVAQAMAAQDPDAKIVLQDGREVDPSDHLPSSSWAALPPNLKKSFDNASARETRLRGVTQPQTRTMQRRDRPQSEMYARPEPMMTPPAAGRNRLVKKSDRNRMTTAQSSPLVPVSANPDRYQRSREDYRSEPDSGRFAAPSRAQTFDMGVAEREREVYGPGYRQGPKVPAKVPIQLPPPTTPMGRGGGRSGSPARDANESAWALLEEMKSIDLGSGTRRRRGGHAVV